MMLICHMQEHCKSALLHLPCQRGEMMRSLLQKYIIKRKIDLCLCLSSFVVVGTILNAFLKLLINCYLPPDNPFCHCLILFIPSLSTCYIRTIHSLKHLLSAYLQSTLNQVLWGVNISTRENTVFTLKKTLVFLYPTKSDC